MRYNCLRINQHVKMFVVGLLLYLGETVFQNAGEETFTVHVQKSYTDLVIEVSDCKGTDKIGVFMKKFEEAYDKKINDKKINDEKINDKKIHDEKINDEKINDEKINDEKINDEKINDEKINDKKINDEKINDEKIEGRIYYFIVSGQRLSSNDQNIRDKTLADYSIGKVRTFMFGFKILGGDEKVSNPMVVTNEENEYNTIEKNEDPATSTCPCSRVCRLCGC